MSGADLNMRPGAKIKYLVVYLLVYLSWSLDIVAPAGNVGCLFNTNVCEMEEQCFDDNAFGRCQSEYDLDSDLYRHSLNADTLQLLEQELSRLLTGGYRWDSDYTQCVVQNILHAKRHSILYDPGLCSRIMMMTIPEVPPEIVSELQNVKPEELAMIKFTPNRDKNDNIIYADEKFTPPGMDSKAIDTPLEEEEEDVKKKKKKSVAKKDFITDLPRRDDVTDEDSLLRRVLEVAKDTQKLLGVEGDFASRLPSNKLSVVKTDLSSDLDNRPIFTEGGMDWLPVQEERSTKVGHFSAPIFGEENNPQFIYSYENTRDVTKTYDTPFRAQENAGSNPYGSKDDFAGGPPFRWNSKHKQPSEKEVFNKFEMDARNLEDDDVTSIEEKDKDYLADILDSASQDNMMNTFQRSMRYDTKKPGYTYFYHGDDNAIGNGDDDNAIGNGVDDDGNEEMESNSKTLPNDDDVLAQLTEDSQRKHLSQLLGSRTKFHVKPPSGFTKVQEDERVKEQLRIQYSPENPFPNAAEKNAAEKNDTDTRDTESKRTTYTLPQSQPEMVEGAAPFMVKMTKNYVAMDDIGRTGEGHHGHFVSVDATHAYLLLKEKGIPVDEGEKLVKSLEKLLKLPTNTFGDVRIDGNQVTFKVNENVQGVNASDVASKAEDLTGDLKSATGYTVESAGIGDKVKYPVTKKSEDNEFFVLTFALCGTVVGVLLITTVVYIIRRHANSKEKLQNIAQPDREASQDYQDLCRQRMASKASEGPETGVHSAFSPKKMRSLSQGEGQASSSSHSSTSSWNEEPVTSNMDISTGHMILSYMEDHLKKKDRLDREWEAMCAYEAEPCSTTVAVLPQNIKKNRYPDVLPYDHSRVVLNEHSNVSGSDYINASPITDHDPRNPAYIATQGPLPHTAADFWQMVWEQGSVVMVMLTRLMENGVAMCHRHWPEEGSEVYHIYEVHLVSEHIWCDDYLVRSFYLKNLGTGETRTVTQFHFLSWPDNGVPNATKALLEFRRKVNKSYRGRSCPIVVHCSDGIGRSGTYVLIDMVLNRMAKGAKEIDIAATLEHVRDQRGGMVKTKAQFEFVLMAIAEEVHAILKALSQ